VAVTLTVSETIDGSAVADALLGAGTGVNLGSVINNSFSNVTDKTNNQGEQSLYIRHDATLDPITSVGFFIQQYGTGTLFSYGGAVTAAADFATLKSLGAASLSSKNNGDGNSGGHWIDMDWDGTDGTRFDQANFPALVKIHGDNGTDGQDLASAFDLVTDAMVYNLPGETAATAPVAGQIGKALDTALGTNAHINSRLYIPLTFPDGGVLQWEWTIKYSFTSACLFALSGGFVSKLVASLSITL